MLRLQCEARVCLLRGVFVRQATCAVWGKLLSMAPVKGKSVSPNCHASPDEIWGLYFGKGVGKRFRGKAPHDNSIFDFRGPHEVERNLKLGLNGFLGKMRER